MANPIIDIRGKTIARSNVTLVEPFDPAKASAVSDAERFKGCVPIDYARAPDVQFRHLRVPDHIATNPDVTYRVEAFDLAEAQRRNPVFQPEREFATRMSRGTGGKGESVLLVNDPDRVVAVVLMGQPDRTQGQKPPEGKIPLQRKASHFRHSHPDGFRRLSLAIRFFWALRPRASRAAVGCS